MELLIGTLIGIIGILVTVIIFLYQERSSLVTIECDVLPDGNPSVIECKVYNTGRAEAEMCILGLIGCYPLAHG
jgi:hypothetical protein